RAAAACNRWVAAAARARGDEAAARWAERFAKAMGEPAPANARAPLRLYPLASIARTRGVTSRA
ncbi:MAG: hypothetical protein KGM15_05160, partial [Pseudomonadota bacterium]|nr:hypothetical protein [Pseudomonadota bacterium]